MPTQSARPTKILAIAACHWLAHAQTRTLAAARVTLHETMCPRWSACRRAGGVAGSRSAAATTTPPRVRYPS